MSNKKLSSVIAAGSLLLTFVPLGDAPPLQAQAVSIATVTGRVMDEQGALVSGAQIRMTGVDTGTVYNAVTNADGIYTIPSLPIGAYTLQSIVPGFHT
jgi:carboxypeptidase family protein